MILKPLPLFKYLFMAPQPAEKPVRRVRRKLVSSSSMGEESFWVDNRPGHSILMGRFRVNGQIIHVSHSQWEGDSHPLTVTQRQEILRKTIVERLRKMRGNSSN